MSEQIYGRLLRLLAPGFHRAYGEEATRLVRERCRDERGFTAKLCLWFVLLVDLAMAAIRDGGFRRRVLAWQFVAASGIKSPLPSFAAVKFGWPHPVALLLGGALSVGLWAMLPSLAFHGGRLQAGSLPSGTFAGDASMTADEKERVLDGVIANLRESYVYPRIAESMIAAVRTHWKKGDYEKATDEELAALLTKHLQAVSHDLHLRVVYSAGESRPLGPPEADPDFRTMLERDNCAFRKVEILPHNIGYVKLDAFGPVTLCRATAAAAMQFIAHTDGLIFDLRENQGGDPHMVSFIASYLFDHRTHLNDIYTQSNRSTEEFWTTEKTDAPKFGKTPAFVLTSAATFSGAEEFTYDLKNLKRAVIVGETTGGGAHLVMMHRVGDHFLVGVPFARPINPVSKTDWEGTGVVPDVKAEPAKALAVAEQLALGRMR